MRDHLRTQDVCYEEAYWSDVEGAAGRVGKGEWAGRRQCRSPVPPVGAATAVGAVVLWCVNTRWWWEPPWEVSG